VVTVILPQWDVQPAGLKNAFYRVGQRALELGLCNQEGGAPKKIGNL
jgi:hypothetical protein